VPIRKLFRRDFTAPTVLFCLFLVITLSAVVLVAKNAGRSDEDLSDEGIMKYSRQHLLKPSIPLAFSPDPTPTPEITHTLVAAFYDTENFATAKLLLNNKGLETIVVHPTLYSLEPKNVSFAKLFFREGGGTAQASGFYSSVNGAQHPPSGMMFTINDCDINKGCKAFDYDSIVDYNTNQSFAVGQFVWDIEWLYGYTDSLQGTQVQFHTARHQANATATGAASIQKEGSGVFSKAANDASVNCAYIMGLVSRSVLLEEGCDIKEER
jgi:hypothetical protein